MLDKATINLIQKNQDLINQLNLKHIATPELLNALTEAEIYPFSELSEFFASESEWNRLLQYHDWIDSAELDPRYWGDSSYWTESKTNALMKVLLSLGLEVWKLQNISLAGTDIESTYYTDYVVCSPESDKDVAAEFVDRISYLDYDQFTPQVFGLKGDLFEHWKNYGIDLNDFEEDLYRYLQSHLKRYAVPIKLSSAQIKDPSYLI